MNIEVYCDESGQELFRSKARGEKYVLIGGIWIRAEERQDHKDAIKRLRGKHAVHNEFKWKKVSPSRLAFYEDLVDLFFQREMNFRTLVLRADELDVLKFSQSDNELMFYKFYYQLLHHWILDLNDYRIFVDIKTNRRPDRIKVLKKCLVLSNLSSKVDVQALPSEEVDLIQLVDLLMGAVSYKFHKTTTSQAKQRVVRRVEQQLGRVICATSRDARKFNVFRFRSGGGW